MALRDKDPNILGPLMDTDAIWKGSDVADLPKTAKFGVIGPPKAFTSGPGVIGERPKLVSHPNQSTGRGPFRIFNDNRWKYAPSVSGPPPGFSPSDISRRGLLPVSPPSLSRVDANSFLAVEGPLPSSFGNLSLKPSEVNKADSFVTDVAVDKDGRLSFKISPRRLTFTEDHLGNGDDASPKSYDFKDLLLPHEKPKSCGDYAQLMSRILEDSSMKDRPGHLYCILCHMLDANNNGNSSVRPDGGLYNKVMHSFAMEGDAQKVEELFEAMCGIYEQGDDLAKPNVRHYTTLLFGWQRSRNPEGPERCELILDKMLGLHERGILRCKPDVYAYTTVLHTWAESRRKDAPARAEHLFRVMKDAYENGDTSLQPDQIAYSNLMNAILNGDGFAHAEDILWEMFDDFLKGNDKCKPRIRNLNSILAKWANANSPFAPERAEAMICRWLKVTETMGLKVYPDNYTFCLLLKCWTTSNRRDTASRLEATLQWMEKLAKQGCRAAELDAIKISTCVTFWVSVKRPHYAEKVLLKVARAYSKERSGTVPDLKLFAPTIRLLCQCGNIAAGEELLREFWHSRRFETHRPNSYAITKYVIKSWCDAGHPDCAEAFLGEMNRLSRAGAILERTDASMFTQVMEAWDRSTFHHKYDHIRILRAARAKKHGAGA